MKTCKRCKEDKPTTEFFNQSRKPDGKQVYCKTCSKTLVLEYKAFLKEKTGIGYKRKFIKERYNQQPT